MTSDKRIYLDNAATTCLDKAVLDEMMPYLSEHFGNPSSIHANGAKVRSAVEQARKKIATLLNTSPSEIFFTSGGTEADNTAIRSAIETFGLEHAITSPLEHHAVLHTLEDLAKLGKIQLHLVKFDHKGNIDLKDLENILAKNKKCLVSLMYANNELGNLLDMEAVGALCEKYQAYFHSDCVQAVGHYPIDLQALKVHSLAAAAHKFHGPKGVGLMYMRADAKLKPFITGGAQERNMRGGTENVYGIVGLAKALEIAHAEMNTQVPHIQGLKKHMIEQLRAKFPEIRFNGESENLEKSLYTVLNVSLPPSETGDMLLFNLDIRKISASGGSACSSGSEVGSHVLRALKTDLQRASVRFSFSKYNTIADIDYAVGQLVELYS